MNNITTHTEQIIVKPEIIKKEIILTAQELEQEREKQLKKIQKNIVLPGFRKGHTPMSMIKKKYNDIVFYDAFEDLLKNRTVEILEQQPSKPLYYVHNFQESVKDDGTDKNIILEFLLRPEVNVDIKEIELVKYKFTDEQKKIFSDIVILHNLVKENPVEKLENTDSIFLLKTQIRSEVVNTNNQENHQSDTSSETDDWQIREKEADIHSLQFKSIKLNELLPGTIEKNQSYTINVDKWINALEAGDSNKKGSIYYFLKELKEKNINEASFYVREIHLYPSLEEFLDIDKIREVLDIDDNTQINIELLYNKLFEIADIVADYFSGLQNIRKNNSFMNNLLDIQIPDDFIQKVYDTYLSKENKKHISTDDFKLELIEEIKEDILSKLFPHTHNTNRNIDEQLINNVAKTYLVQHLIIFIRLTNIISIFSFILYDLSNSDKKYRKEAIEDIFIRDSVFSLADNLAKDIKVTYKVENINETNLPYYLGLTPQVFA